VRLRVDRGDVRGRRRRRTPRPVADRRVRDGGGGAGVKYDRRRRVVRRRDAAQSKSVRQRDGRLRGVASAPGGDRVVKRDERPADERARLLVASRDGDLAMDTKRRMSGWS
jgi:hypothetical protein